MKKINRKGFTLIELLAVIVILAIIMVVTIPTVIGSMNQARDNSLQNATDSVAEWFAKEYELAALGTFAGGADAAYNTYINALGDKSIEGTASTAGEKLTAEVLTAAGISNAAKNFDLSTSGASYVYYNTTTKRVCVKLTAVSSGSFYVNSTEKVGNVLKYPNVKTSSGC